MKAEIIFPLIGERAVHDTKGNNTKVLFTGLFSRLERIAHYYKAKNQNSQNKLTHAHANTTHTSLSIA